MVSNVCYFSCFFSIYEVNGQKLAENVEELIKIGLNGRYDRIKDSKIYRIRFSQKRIPVWVSSARRLESL